MSQTWTIPNLLSASRIVAAPFLLMLAWFGEAQLFIALLTLTFITDGLDGYLARRWQQTSSLGARLDSWGDLAIYFILPVCLWWLWPDMILREWPWLVMLVISYVVPILVAVIKFGGITSYHTWLVKAAAVMVASGLLLLLVGGAGWLFHLAVPLAIVAGLEETLISLLLRERKNDIPTLWHARRITIAEKQSD